LEKRLKIADIVIGNRHRKNFGDLKGLAHSIKTVGLLQPIGVTKDGGRLVFGERRLRAVQMNGDNEIDCRILDINDILTAEDHENRFRLELTFSEKAALSRELEAQMPKRQGKGGGGNHSKSTNSTSPQPGGKCSGDRHSLETSEKIAEKAGFESDQEMKKVQTVVEKGTDELVEALDQGNISPTSAARVAEMPKEKQQEFLDNHRGDNGRIHPRSMALLWSDKMKELAQRIRGFTHIKGNDSATIGEVMASPLWSSSTPAEKKACILETIAAAKALTALAKKMAAHKNSGSRKKERSS
jgi:hypothetical protein